MDSASLESAGWMTVDPSGFTGLAGPFWTRGTGSQRILGLIAELRHSNNHLGTVHGGVLMTFADICLGCAVVDALGAPSCVTVQLQIHFVAAAKTGDFITCKPEVIRRSTQLVFARGLINVGEKTVASADGIWKALEPRTRE